MIYLSSLNSPMNIRFQKEGSGCTTPLRWNFHRVNSLRLDSQNFQWLNSQFQNCHTILPFISLFSPPHPRHPHLSPAIPALLFHELLQGLASVVGLVQRQQGILESLVLQRPTHAHVPAQRAEPDLTDEVLWILLEKDGDMLRLKVEFLWKMWEQMVSDIYENVYMCLYTI